MKVQVCDWQYVYIKMQLKRNARQKMQLTGQNLHNEHA